jgi:hypothetical protein
VTTSIGLPQYVAALARTVDLLRRSHEAGEPQKAALRALVAAAGDRSVTLRNYDGQLTVDGEAVPLEDPRLAAFATRLALHNVAEIVIAKGAEPTELLALTGGIAAEAGQGRIKERLRDASSTRVMVVVHQAVDPLHRPVTISGAFAKVRNDEQSLVEWNRFLSQGAKNETEIDMGFKAMQTGEMQVRFDDVDPAAVPTARVPEAAPPPPPPALPSPPTLQAANPLGVGLARVLADPYGSEALTRLTQLARNIEDAFSRDGTPEAIDALNTVIELESQAPDARTKGTYGVILNRVLTRPALARVAPFLLEPKRRHRAAIVLLRGGDTAAGLLVQLIVDAHSLGERMVYFDVLRPIPQGCDKLLSQLTRGEWQLIRNLGELCGEARLEAAVPYLARLLDHGEDRVRRAVLVALARIGTAQTVEPLRGALKTGTPELKAAVAAAIGGVQARALTAPLSALAADEENPDVARAYVKAIGRIGTPEAKQVLERIAAQRSLFSRKAKLLKDAAEETLRTFAGSA